MLAAFCPIQRFHARDILRKQPAKTGEGQNAEKRENNLPAGLYDEISREIGPLLPQGQQKQIVARITKVITADEAFSGPIAHPRHLRDYEEILPGSAERIVSMAEQAQRHNQEMERTVVGESLRISKVAMFSGSAVLSVLIYCAVYAGMNGNNLLACSFLGTGFLGGAATLIRGWMKN